MALQRRWSVHDFDDLVVGAGLMAGAANVIMQLGRPGVGHGVLESKVDSGNLFKRPYKRSRTTFTYLSVATLGTEQEKKAYRREVNRSHAQVRSTESSPVSYNAFDPELQLWVAACLYRGFEDSFVAMTGRELLPEQRERVYAASAPLGTTLQVKPEMWPASRAEFDEYWEKNLAEVRIDPPVREHLLAIAELSFLPKPVRALFAPFNKFVTTGFLPQTFRDQMGLSWTRGDQRRFNLLTRVIGALVLRLPTPLRQFPYNYFLWDLRRRLRRGAPLV